MAEERLIDDDKDRKYKIRKNADGEDELVIDAAPEEEEPAEEIGFEVPELEDDEEAAVMTPEQLAARERAREEAEEKRKLQIAQYAERAKQLLSEENYGDAAYVLEAAEDLNAADGELSLFKLRALTMDFTDFSKVEECGYALDAIKKRASTDVKAQLNVYAERIAEAKSALEKEVENLNGENELKKEERREKFKARKKSSLIFFAATVIPLVVFAALAIYYGANMHAVKDGANIPLFIAFISVTGFFFILSLFTARRLWQSVNLVKLNENNSSTKLGREFEEKKSRLELLNGISEVINETDIS